MHERFLSFLGIVSIAALASCSSSSTLPAATSDAGADALAPPLETAACTGETTRCLSGTVTLKRFSAPFSIAKVSLFRVYPYGNVKETNAMALAKDGTFAFSNLATWGHYYVQAVVRFGPKDPDGSSGHSVASIVGPLGIPAAGGSIDIAVKPVFLEVLQQRPTAGATTVAWASAHVYDPTSGAELTDATVTFAAGAKQWPMPYAKNVSGTQSYFVQVEAGVAGGTAFTITTSHASLGGAPLTWNLVGEPATFDGAITSPAPFSVVPAKTTLGVTWTPSPDAAYSVTELFQGTTGNYTQKYISASANAADSTQEAIPASALDATGQYLLNVAYSKATCPASADGCVYNLSTAASTFNAQ